MVKTDKKKVLVKEKLFTISPVAEELSIVGTKTLRVDSYTKVTGSLKYGSDLPHQDVLVGKVLRSPLPHALIKKINKGKAAVLPGIHAVLTAVDVPGRNGFGAIIPDQPVICGDKVRYCQPGSETDRSGI
jgi:CO/xanthine dehydrogenase Mo-binding subunit